VGGGNDHRQAAVVLKFRLRGQEKLRDLSRDLRRAADKDLRAELIQGLKAANEPMVRRLKRAFETARIRGMRKPGAKRRFTDVIPSKGLRRPMARAIEGQVRTSGSDPRAQLVLREDRVPVRIRPLIPMFAGASPFRHPIMAKKGPREGWSWASQSIEDSWWPTIRPHIGDYRREAEEAVDRVADKIERG